jgi:Aspartyl protease/PDZ domain
LKELALLVNSTFGWFPLAFDADKLAHWKPVNIRLQLSIFNVLVLVLSMSLAISAHQPNKRKAAQNPSRPPTVRFISANNSVKIPFELSSNLILLQAKVNDSGPLWFILDTGADSTVIDSELAKDLRLTPRGKVVGTGSAGTAPAIVYRGVSIELPNVEALNLKISGLPIDFLSAPLGRKISGVIGNDILKELVVEVDYANQVINLYEPKSYKYSGAGVVLPITIEENLPFVRARISLASRAPIAGKFELDSGSTGATTFNTPFVDRFRLLDSISRTSKTRLGGVGGTAQAFSARLKSMRFGSFELQNSVARFSRATRGDDASSKYGGLIGGEILRRFKMVFDYSRRQVILEANAYFSEPFEVDMSGLDLATEGEDYSIVVVNEVEKNSPGSEAGIQEEDIIEAIDGRPAKELTINQIRKMFMQHGKEYLVSLKRGQTDVRTKLRLRRLV